MNIPFVKMHANGNDFVIIDCRTNNFKFDKSQISRLSNRHTGIGCDQFILLEKSQKRDIFMKIYFFLETHYIQFTHWQDKVSI